MPNPCIVSKLSNYPEMLKDFEASDSRATDIKLIKKYNKQIHGELEQLKKSLNPKYGIKPFVEVDNTVAIEEIKSKYQKEIDGLKTPKPTPKKPSVSVLDKPIEEVSAKDILAEINRLVNSAGDADMTNADLKSGGNIIEYISKAKAVLQGLYPKAKLEVYDTTKEYEAAGGSEDSRGYVIMGKDGEHRILLNLKEIKRDGSGKTAFHEVIHPIVYDAFGMDNTKLIPIWNELARSMKDVKGMENVFNHVLWYNSNKIAVEGITETLTQIAAGNIDLSSVPKSQANKFIDLINKIFESLGIELRINSINDFQVVAQKIKEAFDTSNPASLKDIVKGNNIDRFISAFEKNK